MRDEWRLVCENNAFLSLWSVWLSLERDKLAGIGERRPYSQAREFEGYILMGELYTNKLIVYVILLLKYLSFEKLVTSSRLD